MEAERIHKERKLKARKKREIKQQKEFSAVLEEKKAIEDELEDLRQSLVTSNEARNNHVETVEKKLQKVTKKFEKKLQNANNQLEELKEVRLNVTETIFSDAFIL